MSKCSYFMIYVLIKTLSVAFGYEESQEAHIARLLLFFIEISSNMENCFLKNILLDLYFYNEYVTILII